MTYPLNVSLPSPLVGFAVANDETEHAALTERGYLPALAATDAAPQEDGAQPQHPSEPSDGAAPRKPGRPRKS